MHTRSPLFTGLSISEKYEKIHHFTYGVENFGIFGQYSAPKGLAFVRFGMIYYEYKGGPDETGLGSTERRSKKHRAHQPMRLQAVYVFSDQSVWNILVHFQLSIRQRR